MHTISFYSFSEKLPDHHQLVYFLNKGNYSIHCATIEFEWIHKTEGWWCDYENEYNENLDDYELQIRIDYDDKEEVFNVKDIKSYSHLYWIDAADPFK